MMVPVSLPWGEQGDIAKMVSGLLWHENEHLQDVLKVTGHSAKSSMAETAEADLEAEAK